MNKPQPRCSRRLISRVTGLWRDRIISGELLIGTPLPSPAEIAQKSGISTISANRIMTKLADEGLISRMKGKGSFVMKNTAVKKQHTIGLAFNLPDGNQQEVAAAFTVFQKNAASAIKESGHELCYIAPPDLQDPERCEKILAQTDAVILSVNCLNAQAIELLQQYRHPCILIQQSYSLALPFHQVIPELSCGFFAALKRFKELGKNHISIIGKNSEMHKGRMRIFRECAITQGYSPEQLEWIPAEPVVADLGRMSGYRLGQKILSGTASRTIFSVSDFTSFGLIDAFSEAGMRAGNDYHLISFDNLEGEGLEPFGKPLLTSVTFPKQAIARQSVELAIRLIENPTKHLETIRIPTNLISRETA